MKLVIEDEKGTRTVVPFAERELTVGRSAERGIVRLPDRDVSRRHARFLQVNGAVFVEDLSSLTGTRVNGDRIAGRRRLREGDLVEIGDYDLAVIPDQVLATVAGPGAPPPLPGLDERAPLPTPVAAPPAPVPPPAPRPGMTPGPAPEATPAPRRGVFFLACAAALVLGIAAGYLAGRLAFGHPMTSSTSPSATD
ncbi:MAG TPA: FHA domain-containing protein [Anaeromyxobacter sp.]|nr:FHA domain-containing protein [Anaeromyxobacter sp.]